MSDLFESYEEEFSELKLQIEQRTRNIPTLDGANRRSEVQLAESELKDLDQMLRTMNLSARSNPKVIYKVKNYEQEVVKLRSALRKANMEVGVSSDRKELFSGIRTDEVMASSMGQRERLINANDRLEKSSFELEETQRVALDTMDVGVQILTDLDEHTQKMRKMKDDLSEIDDSLGKAKRIMKSMARRAIANKMILVIIALVLVAAIGIVIYVKWFTGSSTSTTNDGSTTGYVTGTSGTGTTGMLTSSTG